MNFNSYKNYSVISLILVIACLVGGYYVYSSMWSKYNNAKAGYAAAEAQNASLNQALATMKNFLITYQGLAENAPKANLALPRHDSDLADFVTNLAQLSTQSGMSLGNFRIQEEGKPPADNAIAVANLGVDTSGTYTSFQDFLDRIQKNLRLIDITHISLHTGSGTGSSAIMQYSVSFRTYYQK